MADANKKKGNPVINFIKRYFFTGLLISAPIGATIYLQYLLSNLLLVWFQTDLTQMGYYLRSLAIKFLALN